MITAALVLPSLIIIVLYLLYLYLTRNYDYWKKQNIPYLPPSIIGGNTLRVILNQQSIGDCMEELHKQTDEPFVGIITLDQPAVLIRCRDIFKNILTKDFNYFVDRSFAPFEDLELQGLFGLKGEKWRKLRTKLSPSFTSGKMKNMFYLVRAAAEQLDTLLAEYASENRSINIRDISSRFTFDSIATCTFGIEIRAMKDPSWDFFQMTLKSVRLTTLESTKSNLMFFAPWIIKLFRLSLFDLSFYGIMREAVWSQIHYRQTNNVVRNDFLDLLKDVRLQTLAEKEKDPNALVLDGDLLMAQAFDFLSAGFETSSHTISMTLYQMALDQDVQTKARQEIQNVLAKYNNEVTYDSLKEMVYLKQCIDETLRLYPPLPFLDRICTNDYTIPGTKCRITKGMRVYMSIISLHKDPEIYPNPEKYDPDRFAEDKIQNYKGSYYPFGDGPRICIGMRFGIMQVKAALVQVLKNYLVEPAADTPIPVQFETQFNLTIKNGYLPLMIKKL